MSRYWVRTLEKQSAGPFTPKQIRKLTWVSEETMVYPEHAAGAGVDAWKHVRDVPELLELISPPAPSEPEPAPAPAAPPPSSSLAPKLALLALVAGAAAFGYKYWANSQPKPAPVAPPTPPPAPAPATPPLPSPNDMAGYKNSRWGMTRDEASAALGTPLADAPEFLGSTKSPAADWAVNSVLYELWGVPKSTGTTGVAAYEDGDVPDLFSTAKSPSGDVAAFFGGKLFAYSFEVHAKNYDESLRTLTGKYGPGHAVTLTISQPGATTPQEAAPHEQLVRTWERGRTLIHLSHGTWTESGAAMTDAHLIYESRDLRRQVIDAIQKAAAQNRIMRSGQEAAEQQDELKKLE
jgi:hypothetical protein